MSDSSESAADDSWEQLMGKDVMIRRVVSCSGDTASMHTVVTCNLTGYVVGTNTADNDELSSSKKVDWQNLPPTQTPFESLHRQSYKVGEGDAIPGIELALRHSRVGEILRVRCAARFAYGHIGRPAIDSGPYESLLIAPHCDLEYRVEILSHLSEGQIDPQLLAVRGEADEGVDATRHLQRLQALTELMQRKEAGNRWFTYSDFARAARAYSKATKTADLFFNGSEAEKNNALMEVVKKTREEGGEDSDAAAVNAKANAEIAALTEAEANKRRFETADEQLLEVYVSCLNNMAACQLKLGEHVKAKEICVRVLEIQPDNLKALLRAAKAALATHCFEECELCLQQLLLIAPPGSAPAAAAKVERQALRQAKEKYRQSSKAMAKNIAKKLFVVDRKEATGSVSGSTTSIEVEPTTTNSMPEEEQEEEEQQPVGRTEETSGSTVTKNVVSTKGTYSPSSSIAENPKNADAAVAPPTSFSPTEQQKSVAPSSSKGPAADLGLLLLLATSLLVLAVSVGLVLWANIIAPEEEQVRTEDLSDF